MEILNMNQNPDHHVLVFQLGFWKDKSDLSRMSKFKMFSQDLSLATVEIKNGRILF